MYKKAGSQTPTRVRGELRESQLELDFISSREAATSKCQLIEFPFSQTSHARKARRAFERISAQADELKW